MSLSIGSIKENENILWHCAHNREDLLQTTWKFFSQNNNEPHNNQVCDPCWRFSCWGQVHKYLKSACMVEKLLWWFPFWFIFICFVLSKIVIFNSVESCSYFSFWLLHYFLKLKLLCCISVSIICANFCHNESWFTVELLSS